MPPEQNKPSLGGIKSSPRFPDSAKLRADLPSSLEHQLKLWGVARHSPRNLQDWRISEDAQLSVPREHNKPLLGGIKYSPRFPD